MCITQSSPIASEHLVYSVRVMWSISILHFVVCAARQPLVTIHLHYLIKSRVNILLNFSFCILQKKERHLGSERQQVEEIIIIIFVHTQLNTTAMLQYVFTLDPNPCLVLFLFLCAITSMQGKCKPRGKISCSCVCTSTQHSSWRTLN